MPSIKWSEKLIGENEFVGWDEIIGLKNTKEDLESTFLYALRFPSLFLNKPRNMLLYGPPGNGKTFLIRALAKKMFPNVDILHIADCTAFEIK